MTNEKSVKTQSRELQKVAHEITSECMLINEQFHVVLIGKLSSSWKNLKNTLRHKTKNISLKSLITQLRIKDATRRQDRKESDNIVPKRTSTVVLRPVLKPKGNKMKV